MKKCSLWIWSALTLVLALAGGAWYYGYIDGKSKAPRYGRYDPPPPSAKVEFPQGEAPCPNERPEWRKAQEIEGVQIDESPVCSPDNPYQVAAFVKGTNNVDHMTLMEAELSGDAVILDNDRDGDGDPDDVQIKLEVAELNGKSPDANFPTPQYSIAPGIQPSLWVFVPKMHGMATKDIESMEANSLLRAPSPTIRVEQGDRVFITLENTHYMPHTIHLHGIDHPYVNGKGEPNDGAEHVSEHGVMPGEARTYSFQARQTGSFLYHCHVQPQIHFSMGLVGMIVVEENRPNNWVQTLNVGAGKVRHPSVAVKEKYDQEYDMVWQDLNKDMHSIPQTMGDPRLVARAMRFHNVTTSPSNYFLLNGRSYPYTLRESLITPKPDQKIKLRLLNAGTEPIAVHTHGHKVDITHLDGIEVQESARVKHDVVSISPAQRVDVELNTTNDGTHNYGEGLWMVHDHTEKTFGNDGFHPGGGLTLIAYPSYIGTNGMPKVNADLSTHFTKEIYQKKIPNFADMPGAEVLNDPEAAPAPIVRNTLLAFLGGLLLGGVFLGLRRLFRREEAV